MPTRVSGDHAAIILLGNIVALLIVALIFQSLHAYVLSISFGILALGGLIYITPKTNSENI